MLTRALVSRSLRTVRTGYVYRPSRGLYAPEAQGSLPQGATTVRTPYAYQPRACRTYRVPCGGTPGKTLIASVVMHNFLQWFPTGTVVFMAPTRPLARRAV